MLLIERTFVNYIIANAFKAGIDFCDDPDYRAREPVKAKNGSTNWVVVIEDYNDETEEDGEEPIEAGDEDARPVKVSFEEYKALVSKNMKPMTAKPEIAAPVQMRSHKVDELTTIIKLAAFKKTQVLGKAARATDPAMRLKYLVEAHEQQKIIEANTINEVAMNDRE
jgi:hypothetical protein